MGQQRADCLNLSRLGRLDQWSDISRRSGCRRRLEEEGSRKDDSDGQKHVCKLSYLDKRCHEFGTTINAEDTEVTEPLDG